MAFDNMQSHLDLYFPIFQSFDILKSKLPYLKILYLWEQHVI